MHTVELLDEALESARAIGYEVREDWLGGIGGGACLVKGRWRLYVDLNQTPRERLDQVLEILSRADEPATIAFPTAIRGLVQARKAA